MTNYSPAIRVCAFLTVLNQIAIGTNGFTARTLKWEKTHGRRQAQPRLSMVRNIDLPEALVFYGRDVVLHDQELKSGVPELLRECLEIETVVILIDNQEASLPKLPENMIVFDELRAPPNPRSIWEAIHSVSVQPRGFGGSSGFGRKPEDPVRNPLPRHTVVFCDSLKVCQAARMAGMRVICLSDNDLADAVIDGFDYLYLDDVATPGSFWLNPPQPRDDDNNKVDPLQVMDSFENSADLFHTANTDETLIGTPCLSDEEMNNILADLDPI